MASTIKQISIFLRNVPKSLGNMAATMKECGINMSAFNLAENSEFGILRIIVKDPEAVLEKLQKKGITAKITHVIGVRMKDEPGAFTPAADALGDAGINIRYAYAFTVHGGEAVLFICVDDPDAAAAVLERAGIPLETECDI